MTVDESTLRVWLAVAGVVVGTWAASHGVALVPGVTAVAAGAVLVSRRRRPVIAALGLVVLVAGIAALRPVARSSSPASPRPSDGIFHASLEGALEEIDDRSAALLAGLTIGDTSGIDYPTIEIFRRSGLAHLVAVSGSNVAIVLGAIAILTTRLSLRVRVLFGAVGLAAYVMVVGPEPSVLRAGGMGAVALFAYVSGRVAAPVNSLGVALIAVLAGKPELLFAVGLHLSAAATLGIVLWSRPLTRRLRVLPGVIRAPVAITLAAQIAVAPIVIGTFERISLVAPVANVLAAPAVPPATILGLTAGVAGFVSDVLARVIGATAAPFATWILWVADRTASLSWASADASAWLGWILGVPIAGAAVTTVVRGWSALTSVG